MCEKKYWILTNHVTCIYYLALLCLNAISGFIDGMLELYGVDIKTGFTNTTNGTLPDGNKSRKFQYMFCCRNDGSTLTEMDLDIKTGTILFPITTTCQPIRGKQNSNCQWQSCIKTCNLKMVNLLYVSLTKLIAKVLLSMSDIAF